MLPFIEKIDVSMAVVSADVSCGKTFCHQFDIINSAAKETKSLWASTLYKFKRVTWLPSYFVRLSVCMLDICLFVCQLLASFSNIVPSGQLLRCADKRIVNIMKVFIERNNMQVELIRFRKKEWLYSRSPSATLDSCWQTVCIVSSWWLHLSDIVHHSIEWCAGVFFLPSCSPKYVVLRYADKRIVNIMKVYIERGNFQLE